MKKSNFLTLSLLLFAAINLISISNLNAQEDFKSWEFKTGHTGLWANNLTFTDHSITIEFWMNMSQATATTVNSNVFESFGDPYGMLLNIRANSANSNALELRIFAKDTQATPQAIYYYVPSATYTEKWTHIAFVISELEQKSYLYINGELSGEKAAPGGYYGNYKSDGTTTRALNIGGAFWSSPKFYGKLADIRVWSVARTAEEVKANFNKHLDEVPAGLFLNYKFNNFERGQANFAGEYNTGYCGPETDWSSYYATETLSLYPRNLTISEGSLSWDTNDGNWEVNVYKADDNTLAFSDTINTNSVSLNSIEALSDGVSYYAKVRTVNNGFWSGSVTSENYTVSKQTTGLNPVGQKIVYRTINGSLVVSVEDTQVLNIYSASGQLVRSVNLIAGDNYIDNLSKGLYLINNKKFIIK